MTPPPPCFTDEAVCLGSFAVYLFSTFLLSHHLGQRFIFVSSVHKHCSESLLAHVCASLQTLILPFYFWCWSEDCILLYTSVILCQSLLRTVDCQSITAAFWKLLVILQTQLLGFIFIAFLIRQSSTTVVFSADQVVAGVAGCFQTLDFSMPFVLAIALIDFLFSFSIWIACFSLKVSSLIFIMVGVCHHRMQNQLQIQNTEVMDITDTTHSLALNTWTINATGHSWSLRKTC